MTKVYWPETVAVNVTGNAVDSSAIDTITSDVTVPDDNVIGDVIKSCDDVAPVIVFTAIDERSPDIIFIKTTIIKITQLMCYRDIFIKI